MWWRPSSRIAVLPQVFATARVPEDMTLLRRLTMGLAAACAALALTAAPSMAIVGGKDAAPGAYPAVAEITFGQSFLCTGTLIAPTWVLTAGHCGSMTGAAVGTPAGWPAPLFDVRIGSGKTGQARRTRSRASRSSRK